MKEKSKKILVYITSIFLVLSSVISCDCYSSSVHAEGVVPSLNDTFDITVDNLLSQSDFQSSDTYDSSAHLLLYNGSYSNAYDNFENRTYDFPSDYTCGSLDRYFILSGDENVTTTYGYLPEGSFINSYDNVEIYIPYDELSNFPYYYRYNWQLGIDSYVTGLQGTGNYKCVIDGVEYSKIYTMSSYYGWNYMLSTNCPIYSISGTVTSLIGQNQLNYTDAYISSIYNPVAEHEKLGENSGIYLNNSTCNKGTVYVLADVDNYQADASNGYYIKYWVECTYQVDIPENANLTNSSLRNVFNNLGLGYGAGTKTVNGNYYYEDYPYQKISCSAFKDGYWTEDFNFTNKHLMYNGSSIEPLAAKIADGVSWTAALVNGAAQDGTSILSSGSGDGVSIGINNQKVSNFVTSEYEIKTISYTFYMTLCDKDDNELGIISQPYNLGTGTSTGRGDTTDTLTASPSEINEVASNGEGGYNKEYASANDIQVTGGNSSSSSPSSSTSNSSGGSVSGGNSTSNIGDGAIVNNNNPTFNINANGGSGGSGGSSSDSNSLLETLLTGGLIATLFTTISNNNSSSVDTISGITDASGYLDLANTMLSSVPIGFWTVLLTTFTACLGIMVVAFIIKIVLTLVLKL